MATVDTLQMLASLIVVSLVLHTANCMLPIEEGSSSNNEYITGINELLNNIDDRVEPCDDFYRYACGLWKQRNPVPEGTSHIDTISLMRANHINKLKDLLKEDIKAGDGEAIAKAKTLYRSCMDEPQIDRRGAEPLIEVLNGKFGGWPLLGTKPDNSQASSSSSSYVMAPPDWLELLATMSTYSDMILIGLTFDKSRLDPSRYVIGLHPTSLGLPSLDYYKFGSPQMKAYEKYLTRMARLLNANNVNLDSDIKEILQFELSLAQLLKVSEIESSANHISMNLIELQSSMPDINWNVYFEKALPGFNIKSEQQIELNGLNIIKVILSLVHETTNKQTVINYLIWRFTMNWADILGKPFSDIKHGFENEISGIKIQEEPRHRVCAEFVNNNMGMAAGSLFIRHHLDDDFVKKATVTANRIRTALILNLKGAQWMDAETRLAAAEKQNLMSVLIGYPDWILDHDKLAQVYSDLEFSTESFFENAVQIVRLNAKKIQSKLEERMKRDEWRMSPSSVRVDYSISKNQLTLPAGILQPPLFHPKYPRSLIYGGLGTIIGHEIARGFDHIGAHFDGSGDRHSWWSQSTFNRFNSVSQSMVRKYDTYIVRIGDHSYRVNGTGALAGSLDDIAGLRAAYTAYLHDVRVNGLDPALPDLNLTHEQMFFIKFAQNWCQNITPQALTGVYEGHPNPLGKIRVFGTLSNFYPFTRTFGCGIGTSMNPSDRVKVW